MGHPGGAGIAKGSVVPVKHRGALGVRLGLARGGFSLAVDLALPVSGITAVFGTSGSGKTTLLRAIAGLEPYARGRVTLCDAVWQDEAAGVRVPVWQRRVGYVFQESSLFEHLDVRGNIEYGLRWQGARRGRASQRTDMADRIALPGEARDGQHGAQAELDALIDLLGIGGLLRRRVDTLSGGERQRVAIARAMAVRPALLLLDEPLAALDFARRDEIMAWLEALRDRIGTPMLYVTHSLEELARLADRAVVMVDGRVAACDVPELALRAAGMGAAAERVVLLRGA